MAVLTTLLTEAQTKNLETQKGAALTIDMGCVASSVLIVSSGRVHFAWQFAESLVGFRYEFPLSPCHTDQGRCRAIASKFSMCL